LVRFVVASINLYKTSRHFVSRERFIVSKTLSDSSCYCSADPCAWHVWRFRRKMLPKRHTYSQTRTV